MIARDEQKRIVRITVNGKVYERDISTRLTLADFLRANLGLTGTHLGCEHGVCGACTILVDGISTRSCLMLAVQADGSAVTTVEGLAQADGALHPLQIAFRNNHALQCGFCTPGMLIAILELLREIPAPSEGDIREAISGNLCRCTGYNSIVTAVLDASVRMKAQEQADAE